MLEGGWEADGTALAVTQAPARFTIVFSGVGIALQTSRTDRMTVSVDGSLPAVVTAADEQYYVATALQDNVVHTVTVAFAGSGSKLLAVGLYADALTGCSLKNANEAEYPTATIDSFEINGRWQIKADQYGVTGAEQWEGEHSLRAVTTATRPTLTAIYERSIAMDKDAKGLQFALKVEDATDILNLTVQLANAAAPSETGWMWQYNADQLMNGWNVVTLPFAGATDQRSTAPDMVYDHFVIYCTAKDGTVLFVDELAYFYRPITVDETLVLDAEADYDGDVRLLNGERSTDTSKGGGYAFKLIEAADLTGEPTIHTNNAAAFKASVDPEKTEFFFYVNIPADQIANITSLTVELTSSGTCDRNEYTWTLDNNALKAYADGDWHKVTLDLLAAKITGGTPDNSALNYIRIYAFTSVGGTYFYVDNIGFKGTGRTTTVMNNIGYREEFLLDADETFNYYWRTEAQPDDRNKKLEGVAVGSTVAASVSADRSKVYDLSIRGVSAGNSSGYGATEMYATPNAIQLDLNEPSRFWVEMDVYVTQQAKDLGTVIHLELGSNGVNDSHEREYIKALNGTDITTGWNTIRFRVSDRPDQLGAVDLHDINTMRIFTQVEPALATGSSLPIYVDNLKFVNNDARNKVSLKKASGAPAKVVTAATSVNASNPNTMKYAAVDSVVAAVNAVDYGADPTGQTDSTKAINMAVKACSRLGGGTVWLPAGNYLVTDSITIYSLVTLRGDWQDPDKGTNYGTVIWAKPASSSATNTGLFIISGSAGVEGLTIYYPEQDINNVKPYPYTFFLPRTYTELESASSASPDSYMGLDYGIHMQRTIKNVTLINAYRGLSVTRNELTMIKNLKGTVLQNGLKLGDTSDVGTIDGVTFKPEYWSNAAFAMRTATRAQIVNWCKANQTSGLTVGTVEQQQFTNITVQGHTYGIFFPSKQDRFMGSGPMYNINISDCTYGLYAEGGTYVSSTGYAPQYSILTGVDWRCGYNISGGSIAGDKYAIYNASTPIQAENNYYVGSITLAGVTVNGSVYDYSAADGNSATPISVYYSASQSYTPDGLSVTAVPADRTVKTTGSYFAVIAEGASEATIQNALTAAGNAGGGIVYLTAGRYVITSGLTVPANVELKGAAGLAQRIANRGTVLDIDQGHAASAGSYATAKAAVTLNGANAGVSGIFFLYNENIMSIDDNKGAFNYYPYSIEGKGTGNWAIDCAIAGGSYGVKMTGANFNLENVITATTRQDITVNGNNGIIRNCLHNGNMLYRTGLTKELDVYEGDHNENGINDSFENYHDGGVNSKANLNYITVNGGSGIRLINNFIYGGNTVLVNNGATDLIAINFGTDSTGNVNFKNNSGSMTVYNPVITAGNLYNGSVKIYNVSSLCKRAWNVN